MSISASDILVYRAEVMDDSAANGGRQSWVQAVSGAPNNIWPDIPDSQRVVGFDLYRKHFWRVQDAGNQTAFNVRITYVGPTPAEDAIYAFQGTDTDTQGDLTGSERLYGSGDLQADVSAGATTLTVTVEDPTRTIFADGDLILVSSFTNESRQTVLAQEWLTVSGTPSLNGSTLTITVSTQLLNSYDVAEFSTVASVIEVGTVQASIANPVVVSASGTADDTQVVAFNIGSENDAITITFASPTTFDVAGTNVGAIGSGNVSSTFIAINPNTGNTMFQIPSTVWGGVWALGETFSFDLNAPAVPIWERRIASPGAASAPDNARALRFHYE